jgi:hypothetical protein
VIAFLSVLISQQLDGTDTVKKKKKI